ncbi:MAG: plastocyanin/azurin family copper-binding protein [Dehalococcoidia bacterium]
MNTAQMVRLSALVAITVATATFLQTTVEEARAGGGCRGTPVTEADGDTVIMSESCFEPSVLRVEPGQEVTWLNQSTQPHSVAGQNTSWGDYEELSNGESVAHAFEKAGTYTYYCFVHNGMIGVVVVGDGKGALTGGVSRVDDEEDEDVLASVPQQPDPQAGLVAVSNNTTDSDGATDWLALAGVAIVGLIAGGGAVALARRR